MTGWRLAARLEKSRDKGLGSYLRFLFEKIVHFQNLNRPVRFARYAQALVVFVNPFVQAPGHAASWTILKDIDHRLVKIRFESVIGMQNLQILCLVPQVEAPVKVAEQPQSLWIG